MAWDKTKPAGATPVNQADDQIRDNNDAIEAALDQDHDFTTGSTQTGTHDQITFTAPRATPEPAASTGVLYIKDVSEKAELFYCDEDGDETQLTSGGVLNMDAAAIALAGITASIAEINTLHSSGITNADLVKLHAVTVAASTINALVTTSRTISAGTGLSGGGSLAANRTISHAAHTGEVTGSTALTIANGVVGSENMQTGTAERDWVNGRIAGSSVGAVGTYAFLSYDGSLSPGDTVSGSNLLYACVAQFSDTGARVLSSGVPSGTWRCMGYVSTYAGYRTASLFLRIE